MLSLNVPMHFWLPVYGSSFFKFSNFQKKELYDLLVEELSTFDYPLMKLSFCS